MKNNNCPTCLKELEIGNWEPSTDGQESHYIAGEKYMCLKCGNTFRLEDIYKQFLRTAQWKKIRFNVFIRDGFGCQDCGKSACEVHHLSYNDILDEDSCISLCHKCHGLRHGRETKKINGWANSLRITFIAKKRNSEKCFKCNESFSFYDEHGFFCCYNCNIAGDIKDFIILWLKNKRNSK